MSTSLRMRNIIVAVYMCGKSSAVLTVTTQSRDLLGIYFVKSFWQNTVSVLHGNKCAVLKFYHLLLCNLCILQRLQQHYNIL